MRSLAHVLELEPEAVLVDAAENPGQGHAVLQAMAEARTARRRSLAIVERTDLERFDWHEVADELVYPGAPEAELARAAGDAPPAARRRRRLRDPPGLPRARHRDLPRDGLSGRALDLTFKEFELLRFLASRPGRVFTRPALLREVWGYDFYGGTRTVDVHVRRLRAKLGPEHEHLVETVRSVGLPGGRARLSRRASAAGPRRSNWVDRLSHQEMTRTGPAPTTPWTPRTSVPERRTAKTPR